MAEILGTQDFTNGKLTKVMKTNYLPVMDHMLSIEPSALLGKIRSVPLVSGHIETAAPYGLSGGFGFGAEGMATPRAGQQNFEKLILDAKDMYVNLCISVKATRLGKTAGAMVDALDTEIKAAYATAKWNMGRALFGNGTGVLAKVDEATGTKEIKVDSIDYLKEGLILDFFAEGATTADEKTATARIKAISRTAEEDGKYKVTMFESVTSDAGFVTVQNSYNREITGLGAIFDDNVKTIYGISKTDNPFIKPTAIDAGDTIDDGIITSALRSAEKVHNSNVDLILAGDAAFDEYVNYLRENNIRIEDKTGQIEGGFKTVQFLFGNRIVDIVNEQFVPVEEMWGVDSSAIEFHKQNWDFASLNGSGGAFDLMENSSVYRALLANYGELLCKNPGGCVRIFNCK